MRKGLHTAASVVLMLIAFVALGMAVADWFTDIEAPPPGLLWLTVFWAFFLAAMDGS